MASADSTSVEVQIQIIDTPGAGNAWTKLMAEYLVAAALNSKAF